MGLTRSQRVGGVINDIAWFTWRERLQVLAYLLNPWHRAS